MIIHYNQQENIELKEGINLNEFLQSKQLSREGVAVAVDEKIVKKAEKPSINWEHVSIKFNYLAEDSDGAVYLYEKKPYTAQDVWGVSDSFSEVTEAYMFASYVKGTCDWKDSLIQRPKGDSHGN